MLLRAIDIKSLQPGSKICARLCKCGAEASYKCFCANIILAMHHIFFCQLGLDVSDGLLTSSLCNFPYIDMFYILCVWWLKTNSIVGSLFCSTARTDKPFNLWSHFAVSLFSNLSYTWVFVRLFLWFIRRKRERAHTTSAGPFSLSCTDTLVSSPELRRSCQGGPYQGVYWCDDPAGEI